MIFRHYSFWKYLFLIVLSSGCVVGRIVLAQIWAVYGVLASVEGLAHASAYFSAYFRTLSMITLGTLSVLGILFALCAFFQAWISDDETTRRMKKLMIGAAIPFVLNLIFLVMTVMG